MSKKILVTGGAGFIGSHLCRRLLADGDNVVCLDNFFTGKRENVSELLDNKNFTLVEHDITEKYDIEVEQIYNLACPASPPSYQFNPVQTFKSSVFGTYNMLELAKSYGASFLQSSTSEIYGDPKIHPQVESYWGNVNPIGIRSCYDEGKRAAETLISDYHRMYGLDTRIVRIFNTYGPYMALDDGRVVSNFIVQALENKDITIYGDGSQTRSFCYVSDLIEGLVRMMNNPQKFIGPVNLGNPSEFTILEFARVIIELTNSNSQIVFKELPQDDPVKRKPDISLAQKELDWIPQVSVREGLTKTIKYFESRL